MRQVSARLFSAGAIGLTLIASGWAKGGPATEAQIGTTANWPGPRGSADESGFSRLEEIAPGTVGRLGLAWHLDLPDEVTLESTPLQIDGTLYFAGGYAEVYAVDAVSGKLKWKFDPETWKRSPDKFHFGADRGIAYEAGRIFTVEMDGRVDALDARTGSVLWHAGSIPATSKTNSSGAPRTMNGKVIIGNSGGGPTERGFVTAFDSATGRMLWRFYTVPGSPEQNGGDPGMEAAAKTWSPDFWKTVAGGGTPWDGMTFDPELNRVYVGVGNSSPYDPQVRSPGGGDNLYLASIVALDADTGKYVWHYQENPGEAWDYKSTSNIVMATLTIAGKPRKVLLHAPTNGFFYVLDRADGRLVNTPGATTLITWAKGIDIRTGRPVENSGIRYESGRSEMWPGTLGGHNWQAMSYSPKTGLVYIPVHQMGTLFSRNPADRGDDAIMNSKIVVKPLVVRPGDNKGYLVAWDPVAQREAWKVTHDHLWNGGTLATAGGLVFQGTADGFFDAYDAATGARLWRFDAGLGIIAAPMSYSVGGRQYVSILVGWGGTVGVMGNLLDVGWKYGAQTRRLLTFALDGADRLAPSPPRDMTVNALDDPDLVLTPADVEAGRKLSGLCMSCHGTGFHSAGAPGPDLRESGIALRLDTFTDLVRQGVMEKGMPRFGPDRLTDEQIRQLHAYLRSRARATIAAPARGTR